MLESIAIYIYILYIYIYIYMYYVYIAKHQRNQQGCILDSVPGMIVYPFDL